jgi:hypothetical protein
VQTAAEENGCGRKRLQANPVHGAMLSKLLAKHLFMHMKLSQDGHVYSDKSAAAVK